MDNTLKFIDVFKKLKQEKDTIKTIYKSDLFTIYTPNIITVEGGTKDNLLRYDIKFDNLGLLEMKKQAKRMLVNRYKKVLIRIRELKQIIMEV